MIKIIIFSISLVFIFAFYALACFSPTDMFAAEVLLNKPGAVYDLGMIKAGENVTFKEGAFIYVSHFDKRAGVILEEVDEAAVAKLKGLSVRIQIPTRNVVKDGANDLEEAVDISRDKFDFKSAMKVELNWLRTNRIISGINDNDFTQIAGISEAGIAGWNSRIVYESDKWLPYNKTNGAIIFRNADCRGFSLENLPYNETIILPKPNNISARGKLATQWGKLKNNQQAGSPDP